jgi:hypothetical protein
MGQRCIVAAQPNDREKSNAISESPPVERDLRDARQVGRMQRFILSRSGDRADDLEEESRAWHIQCTECGSSKSVWELGGVRYKAASRGKRIRGHCSTCGTRRWLRYVRIDPDDSSEAADHGVEADAGAHRRTDEVAGLDGDHIADTTSAPDGSDGGSGPAA